MTSTHLVDEWRRVKRYLGIRRRAARRERFAHDDGHVFGTYVGDGFTLDSFEEGGVAAIYQFGIGLTNDLHQNAVTKSATFGTPTDDSEVERSQVVRMIRVRELDTLQQSAAQSCGVSSLTSLTHCTSLHTSWKPLGANRVSHGTPRVRPIHRGPPFSTLISLDQYEEVPAASSKNTPPGVAGWRAPRRRGRIVGGDGRVTPRRAPSD